MNYAPHPGHRCPTCSSDHPHRHPAMAFEGEVEICTDAYHLIPTNQNRPSYIAEVERKRAAQAIEARRAETGTGSVHESAVSEGNAPDSSSQKDNPND